MGILRVVSTLACAVVLMALSGLVRAQQAVSPPSSATAAEPTTSVARKPVMLVDRGLAKDPTAVAVWVAYAVKLALNHPQMDQERLAGFRVYAPTFDAEVAARENQIVVWNQIAAKQSDVANPYMVDLEAIEHAGFMREYVWEYYGQSGWKNPGDLHISEFDAWRAVHLPKLAPVRHGWLGI